MHRSGIVILLLILAHVGIGPKAHALLIYGGTTTGNQRFGGSFPGSPAANGSFNFSGYDFSGVGWQTASSSFGVTMISPQEYVTAAHVAPSGGSTVTFLNSDGVLKTYSVDSTSPITLTLTGATTDLVVGRLVAPISPADHVAYYPTLLLNTFNDYLGLQVVAYGQTGVVGTNNVDLFLVNFDMLPFGSGNGVADSILLGTQYDAITGETQGQAGDSGSPTFIIASGQLALVGVHSAISSGPDLTLDSFVPGFYSQINSLLGADGYTFGALTAVPEPGPVTLLAGLVAIAAAIRRRRAT